MSLNNCEFCKKYFTSKSILTRHIKTSKNCIKLRTNNSEHLFICCFCNKQLSSKQRLGEHIKICKVKKQLLKDQEDKKYIELQQQMSIITNEIAKIKTTPTTNITINDNSNNNSTNIMNNYKPLLQYMTPSIIKETFEQNYTIKDFAGSQKALADFTTKQFLSGKNKPVYLCTDRSRQHFTFVDKERDMEDQNAMILITLISKGFGTVKKLYKKQLNDLNKRLEMFRESDNLTMITETISQIKELEKNYQQILATQDEGDHYRCQLAKILPSNIDNRLLIDTTIEQLESDEESDQESDQEIDNDNGSDKNIPKNKQEIKQPILHDKTARHIGGITYGKLRMYKNHYQKTGKILIPEHYKNNEEYKREFLTFMHSDE